MEATQASLINDKDCELVVLSTIINRPPMYHEVVEYLDSSCFYELKHQEIYEVIMKIVNEGEPISIISINSVNVRNIPF